LDDVLDDERFLIVVTEILLHLVEDDKS